MSDLSIIEKVKLEKFLDMGTGYVLDFSNRSFQSFVIDSTDIDIYDDKYDYASGSKANRLRALWDKEPNYIVGKLTSDLLEHWETQKSLDFTEITPQEKSIYDECQKIAERLQQGHTIENIEAIQSYSDDKYFFLLAKSIRESIQKDHPEVALDRLHTYLVKYIRLLCDKHSISYDKNRPLHSLFGEYVKKLRRDNKIDTRMTEKILKSSISILSDFNYVRNNQSFAHDNPILNYHESILIFNFVTSAVNFIESIEMEMSQQDFQSEVDAGREDISF